VAHLHPKRIDLSLGRIETLLARLGNPEQNLPPVVHVAGTNGKGSVIAFLRAMVEAAGYRAHVYTSPHLVRFNERIRLAGKLISDDHLAAALEECEALNAGDAITFFEITTAAAYLAFSRTPADVLLLETGLGGRLDATNVIARPLLTVLTPVSLDHKEFLGDTLEKVLAEKAGILKPGVPCVFASQERKAPRLLAKKADELNVPLIAEGKDWHVRKQGGEGFIFKDGSGERTFPLPRLVGAHQVRNAGLAIACLRCMTDFDVPDAAIALGLNSVDWPGRLQLLGKGPLVDGLPEGWEVWLDGGHNAASAKTIAAQFRHWREKPLHLIFGMINSKDPVKFLQPLEGKVKSIRTLAIPGQENALSAQALADAARGLRLEAEPSVSVEAALGAITAPQNAPGRVLITGSLYLAGHVLAANG
jgi:dihydrofolate synthase/folylpolyglutamate synthase